MAATVKKTRSKKSKRNVPNGVVHIQKTWPGLQELTYLAKSELKLHLHTSMELV